MRINMLSRLQNKRRTLLTQIFARVGVRSTVRPNLKKSSRYLSMHPALLIFSQHAVSAPCPYCVHVFEQTALSNHIRRLRKSHIIINPRFAYVDYNASQVYGHVRTPKSATTKKVNPKKRRLQLCMEHIIRCTSFATRDLQLAS